MRNASGAHATTRVASCKPCKPLHHFGQQECQIPVQPCWSERCTPMALPCPSLGVGIKPGCFLSFINFKFIFEVSSPKKHHLRKLANHLLVLTWPGTILMPSHELALVSGMIVITAIWSSIE